MENGIQAMYPTQSMGVWPSKWHTCYSSVFEREKGKKEEEGVGINSQSSLKKIKRFVNGPAEVTHNELISIKLD